MGFSLGIQIVNTNGSSTGPGPSTPPALALGAIVGEAGRAYVESHLGLAIRYGPLAKKHGLR